MDRGMQSQELTVFFCAESAKARIGEYALKILSISSRSTSNKSSSNLRARADGKAVFKHGGEHQTLTVAMQSVWCRSVERLLMHERKCNSLGIHVVLGQVRLYSM